MPGSKVLNYSGACVEELSRVTPAGNTYSFKGRVQLHSLNSDGSCVLCLIDCNIVVEKLIDGRSLPIHLKDEMEQVCYRNSTNSIQQAYSMMDSQVDSMLFLVNYAYNGTE